MRITQRSATPTARNIVATMPVHMWESGRLAITRGPSAPTTPAQASDARYIHCIRR